MALKDIKIPQVEVQVGADSSFAVRGLSTSDLEYLVRTHGETMRSLFDEFVNGANQDLRKLALGPIVMELLKRAPLLVQDTVALAADAQDDEDRAIIARLPSSVQITAMGAIFSLTLTTSGDLGNALETVTQLVSGINEAMDGKLQELAKS